MAERHELLQQAADGERVARLLADDDFQAAFDKVRDRCVKTFLESQGGEEQLREQMWRMAQTVQELRNELQAVVNTGKAARLTLADMPDIKEVS